MKPPLQLKPASHQKEYCRRAVCVGKSSYLALYRITRTEPCWRGVKRPDWVLYQSTHFEVRLYGHAGAREYALLFSCDNARGKGQALAAGAFNVHRDRLHRDEEAERIFREHLDAAAGRTPTPLERAAAELAELAAQRPNDFDLGGAVRELAGTPAQPVLEAGTIAHPALQAPAEPGEVPNPGELARATADVIAPHEGSHEVDVCPCGACVAIRSLPAPELVTVPRRLCPACKQPCDNSQCECSDDCPNFMLQAFDCRGCQHPACVHDGTGCCLADDCTCAELRLHEPEIAAKAHRDAHGPDCACPGFAAGGSR